MSEEEVNTKKIQAAGLKIGGNLDRLNRICGGLKTNATNLKTSIEAANKFIGKRATKYEDIKKYITGPTFEDKKPPIADEHGEVSVPCTVVYNVKYKIWMYSRTDPNCLNRIIDLVSGLQEEISAVLGIGDEIELSGEELEKDLNNILKETGAAAGATLIDETDTKITSGESGDRVLNGDDSNGITDENEEYFKNLGPGEWFYIKAGTGVEAGTYVIIKHTADGREVPMKWISEKTANQWRKKLKAKKETQQTPPETEKTEAQPPITDKLTGKTTGTPPPQDNTPSEEAQPPITDKLNTGTFITQDKSGNDIEVPTDGDDYKVRNDRVDVRKDGVVTSYYENGKAVTRQG